MPATVSPALSSSLRLSVMRLARRLRHERGDTGLGLTHLAAMSTLARHGEMGIGALADHEMVQPPSMTRAVACLEERGLVRRTAHPDDRRQVLVSLTPEGESLLAADRARRDRWLAQRLGELDAEEVAVLRAAAPLLERLAAAAW